VSRGAAVLAAFVLLIAVSGCSGEKAVARPASSVSAAVFRPDDGACHEIVTNLLQSVTYHKVGCDQPHLGETYHLGTAPDAALPPVNGSAGALAAYRECVAQATKFLGAPARTAAIDVTLAWPTIETWQSGARWFECDLVQTDGLGRGQVRRTASLRNELRKPSSTLALHCFATTVDKADKIKTIKAASCGKKHQAEFAGVWTVPERSVATIAKDEKQIVAGCLHVIGQFMHLSDKQLAKTDPGWLYYPPNDDEWAQGEHGFRCYAYDSEDLASRSLKGIGPAAFGLA
jgi:hypothetical protein